MRRLLLSAYMACLSTPPLKKKGSEPAAPAREALAGPM
jgi:hypothetical protein